MPPAPRTVPARARVPLSIVVALFVVSGAAGLVYEVIWIRSLTLVFGKTVPAASAVLTAFMAGLALGSAAGGRVIDRRVGRGQDPLKIYAALEAGIGVWALLLPLVLKGVEIVYVSLSAPFEQLPVWLSAARFVLATLALVPATCLMGATLPALSRWAVRHEAEVGSRLGLLYALNTLGGVTGCLAAGFLLLESLGLWRTTLTAAVANFAVAGLAWSLSRRGDAASPAGGRPAATKAAQGLPPGLVMVMAAVGLGGFGALVLEVTWTRALLLVFGSTAHSFSAMLSVFLLGIGLGSLLMTPFADRLRRPWIALGLLQGGVGLMVLVSARLIDRLPEVYLHLLAWRGLTWRTEIQSKFLLSAALMLLPTLLSGAMWPVAVRLARPRQASLGAEVGRLYAANTVGSILGALAGGFAFLPLLGMQQSMTVISLALAAFGAALVLNERAPLVRRAVVSLALAGLAATLALTMPPWDKKVMTSGAYFMPRNYMDDSGRVVLHERLRDTRLLYYAEGVTTTPSVAVLGDINKAFFNDGKIEGATALDGLRLQRLAGHYPILLARSEAESALVIGMGSGMTVGAMGAHPVARIDCAELEPAVVGAARYFDKETFSVLERPGLRILYNDGRNHLLLDRQPYDVISSEPFAPLVEGAVSLYTLEYFRMSRERLRPGGMVAQFLPLYQLSTADYLGIMKTFYEVFPDATVWITGTETILLGGLSPAGQPPVLDFAAIANRMADPKVAASLREIGLDDPVRLLATYCFRVADVAAELADAPLITDDHTRIEFTAPRSHLINTVRFNLPWLIARMRSPADLVRLPDSWAPDDPRRRQIADRLETLLRVQRLTMEGRLEVLQGDLERGIATMEKAAQMDTADIYARDLAARNLVKLAERLDQQGRTEEAARAYERALRWEPGHFVALYNLAIHAYDRGDQQLARRLTEQALALAPDSPSLNYRMGLLLYNSGDAATAERRLMNALDLDPKYPEPLMVLGDLHQARGDHARASFLYARAIELGKDDAEACSALAQSLANEGRREEAARYVAMALERSPGHPEAIFTRARLSLAEGRREAAAQDLKAALAGGGERFRKRALADPGLRDLLN